MERKPDRHQDAATCYAERYSECQDLLQRIVLQLDRHHAVQAQAPADWGHAESLGEVNKHLAYVLAHLGDRTAVEAKGLEY